MRWFAFIRKVRLMKGAESLSHELLFTQRESFLEGVFTAAHGCERDFGEERKPQTEGEREGAPGRESLNVDDPLRHRA